MSNDVLVLFRFHSVVKGSPVGAYEMAMPVTRVPCLGEHVAPLDTSTIFRVARVTHTLTTPGCPMEKIITDSILGAASLVEGVARVETNLVWEPAWHPGMIAPDSFGHH